MLKLLAHFSQAKNKTLMLNMLQILNINLFMILEADNAKIGGHKINLPAEYLLS